MKTKLKSIFRSLLIVAVSTLVLAACSYDTVVQPEPEVPDEVLFGEHIVPIFEAKCIDAGCHNDGGIPPILTAERAYSSMINFGYVNLNDPASSIIYTKIDEGGSMEQFASDQDRALILAWIEQGALDN